MSNSMGMGGSKLKSTEANPRSTATITLPPLDTGYDNLQTTMDIVNTIKQAQNY